MESAANAFAQVASWPKCDLFTGIEPGELGAMLQCLDARRAAYKRGEFIYRAGDVAYNVGVLLSGAVHALQEDYWGNRSIVDRVQPGGLFAEAFASSQVQVLPVSLVAAQDCEVLLIGYQRIVTTCSSACSFHSRLVRNMMAVLAGNSVHLARKIGHLTQRSTRDKVLSYLSDQALSLGSRFEIPFNRQELADYLAVERSALSAELSRMQAQGLIRFSRNSFELL